MMLVHMHFEKNNAKSKQTMKTKKQINNVFTLYSI